MTNTARKLRFLIRAHARRHYVDPILYREGWFAGPNDAARWHQGAAQRIQMREIVERVPDDDFLPL